ncbi:MAG: hypothetical protein IJS25_07280 [Bacteroidales bacterium]|nr:hypothetical protein [Bacteroidales bacterium]
MLTFNIEEWVPRFIYNDKNGHAIAKAIEVALRRMNDIVARGLACVTDFDAMPEWRLDELAWETDCVYDYTADIETKREWIKNASRFYLNFGTRTGVTQYLNGAFESASVEEADAYGGEPYHFRVIVTGVWSDEADAWARTAVAATMNARSVLDNIIFNGGGTELELYTGAAVCGMEIADSAKAIADQ